MNVNDYVGLPYKVGGRGPDAYDCFGIVAAVYRDLRGVTLPEWYPDGVGTAAAARAIAAALVGEVEAGRATQVLEPDDFDIAVVTSTLASHHIGLVADIGVLHSTEKFGSIWHPLPRFLSIYPKTEFYRWHP